jgi:NADH:ubiquinone reductase (non-electrogenic)
MTTSSTVRPKIVVLGSGFGAFSFMKQIDVQRFAVTVVSPRNHFLFTPLLPSTTVGTVEFRSIIEPIRLARPQCVYYQASCTMIDLAAQRLQCEGVIDRRGFELVYDQLIVAVGGINKTFGIPGVEQYGLFLKELADARAIRQRIIDCFEQAAMPGLDEVERRRLLQFVVVGGGPTGVEFAAELHDFVVDDLRHSYPQAFPFVRITLLEAGDYLLSGFDAALRDYTMKLFRRRHIDVRIHTQVTRVEQERVFMNDGATVPYGLLVWSTGIVPSPLVASLPVAKDRTDRIVVNDFFEVRGTQGVFALGDCATVDGKEYPATAQVAQQQGAYLAALLKRRVRGLPDRPFRYRAYGMLAYVGGHRALADLASFKGKGFSSWLFWRSAYLTKLVSMKNKILVVFDWTKTFLFGRDISRF